MLFKNKIIKYLSGYSSKDIKSKYFNIEAPKLAFWSMIDDHFVKLLSYDRGIYKMIISQIISTILSETERFWPFVFINVNIYNVHINNLSNLWLAWILLSVCLSVVENLIFFKKKKTYEIYQIYQVDFYKYMIQFITSSNVKENLLLHKSFKCILSKCFFYSRRTLTFKTKLLAFVKPYL